MSQTITQGRLRIDANFKRFVDEEVLPGTGLDAAAFWRNFDEIVHDLAPENRQLLAERDRIQAALDEWHRSNPGPVKDKAAYKSFLRELGYLVPQPERVNLPARKSWVGRSSNSALKLAAASVGNMASGEKKSIKCAPSSTAMKSRPSMRSRRRLTPMVC